MDGQPDYTALCAAAEPRPEERDAPAVLDSIDRYG
jgi:hypothetical protein